VGGAIMLGAVVYSALKALRRDPLRMLTNWWEKNVKPLTLYVPVGIISAMDNRSNILDQSLQLFAARGYEAVGVQEICEAAGVTKPTLYHYFGSKRGLLDALLETQFSLLNQVIQEAATYQHDVPSSLQRVAAAYFQFALANKDFYRLQLAMSFAAPQSDPHDAMVIHGQAQYRILEELFFRAALDHGNMRGRQRAYATTFLGVVNAYISMWLFGYATLDEALTRQAVHQFMHGIFS
jgi:AcrR family transcriptional regulator